MRQTRICDKADKHPRLDMADAGIAQRVMRAKADGGRR